MDERIILHGCMKSKFMNWFALAIYNKMTNLQLPHGGQSMKFIQIINDKINQQDSTKPLFLENRGRNFELESFGR